MISKKGLSDKTYEKAVTIYGEQKVAQLMLAIIVINGWNRIAIATHMVADED